MHEEFNCSGGLFALSVVKFSFVKSRVLPFVLACRRLNSIDETLYKYIQSCLYDVLITNVDINDQRL